MSDHKSIALLDSGASGVGFIDPTFAAKCGLALTPSEHTIKLADGTIVPAAGQVSVTYHLAATTGQPIPGPFTSTFTATPLEGYDIILGVGWMAEHDIKVGWRDRSIEVRTAGKASRHIRPLNVIRSSPSVDASLLAEWPAQSRSYPLCGGIICSIYAPHRRRYRSDSGHTHWGQ